MTIEDVETKIREMHTDIKECLEFEMTKPIEEMLPFIEISRICVGDDKSILTRFYNEIIFILKEIIKARIRNSLEQRNCDDIIYECIKYF